MPFYYSIKSKQTAEGLLKLKKAFNETDGCSIPQRTISDTLLLATWNIRELGGKKYGGRKDEAMYYMAEIIDRFDLVAIQEVREDLSALHKLMKYLGGWWKVVYTDVTIGRRGNGERMAFVYDSRKISFAGLAGEVVIPPIEKPGADLVPANQLARTPFIVGFRAGWFKFSICVTHILYGEAVADHPERYKEIKAIADFLADRTRDKYAWSKNMILLGDFNIFKPTDVTMEAIKSAGFTVPEQLQQIPSNVTDDIRKGKHYDQIAFIAPSMVDKLKLCRAGVFNFYKYIYRKEDESVYVNQMGEKYEKKEKDSKKSTYYKQWRTFQMSDHLPMWIELDINFSESYLKNKAESAANEQDN